MAAHFCLCSAFSVVAEVLKVIAEALKSSTVCLNGGSEALRVTGVDGTAFGRGGGLGIAPAVPFYGGVPGRETAPMGGVAALSEVLLPLS